MQARFNDGETAASYPLEVRIADGDLVFGTAEAERRWPLSDLRVEPLGDRVRLASPAGPARLTLAATDWEALCATSAGKRVVPPWRREARLVTGLVVVAAVAVGIIFIGLPLASGPLARRTPVRVERQMGETFATQLNAGFVPCRGADGQAALAAFGERLTKASGSPFEIRPRAVQAPMVNAFALPGGQVLVTGDLIALARSPDELAAVIAHEAAHVEKRHVMQAVWRSFGFGVLLDALVGGGTGAGQQAVLLAGSFTNLRYTRESEGEADAVGQQLLQREGLSSEGMAPFFERIATKGEGHDAEVVKELLSDHPDSLRRAQLSRARGRPGAPAFTAAEWTAIKATCVGTPGPLSRLPHWP